MKSLFPKMEKEILSDRKAERREKAQRAREYIRGRDISWLINNLLENGPKTEHQMMTEKDHLDGYDHLQFIASLLKDLLALWMVGKLWRISLGIHPGSGEAFYLYGIRKVHNRAEHLPK